MGGWGSGRHWCSKVTTDSYHSLDSRWLQREGTLERRYTFNVRWKRNGEPIGNIDIRPQTDRVILSYRTATPGQERVKHEYPVLLERTKCHYGGERVWFRCPARGCGRRVAILYGGTIFACRNCHQLAYSTQHESVTARANSRAWGIRERCGGVGCLLDPLFRPKGMHHRTFRRLAKEYERACATSDWAFCTNMGIRN